MSKILPFRNKKFKIRKHLLGISLELSDVLNKNYFNDILSLREAQVLLCVLSGLGEDSIGEFLGISHKTIKFHKRRILKKGKITFDRLGYKRNTWKTTDIIYFLSDFITHNRGFYQNLRECAIMNNNEKLKLL